MRNGPGILDVIGKEWLGWMKNLYFRVVLFIWPGYVCNMILEILIFEHHQDHRRYVCMLYPMNK